jgi:hypothetical protein
MEAERHPGVPWSVRLGICSLMHNSVCVVIRNLPRIPNNLTVRTSELKSVASRVWDEGLMESEPSAASRTTNDVEHIDALGEKQDDKSDEEPRGFGHNGAGNGRDKRDCPNPIGKEHSPRHWACLCHAHQSCPTLKVSDGSQPPPASATPLGVPAGARSLDRLVGLPMSWI